MDGIINKAVGPCDCALAFAIPLKREDFLRDLQPTSGKDFVKSFAAPRAEVRPEMLWDDFFKPRAEVALEVADEVDKLHVKIFYELKLSELSTALNSREVVALIAHWRDATVKVSDFINVSSFVSRLTAGDSEVARKLTEWLSKNFIEQLNTFDNSEASQKKLKAVLAERLNRALSELQLYRRDILPGDIAHPDRLYQLHLNRVALEEAFAGELIPGNRLELFDGLYSIAEIVKHVPDPFARILDLTSCKSLILGEGIKRLRRDCLVLTNEKPARLDFRVLFFGGVMEELHRERAPYVATVLRLRKQLLKTRGLE